MMMIPLLLLRGSSRLPNKCGVAYIITLGKLTVPYLRYLRARRVYSLTSRTPRIQNIKPSKHQELAFEIIYSFDPLSFVYGKMKKTLHASCPCIDARRGN